MAVLEDNRRSVFDVAQQNARELREPVSLA
jgi:hypothetical protein